MLCATAWMEVSYSYSSTFLSFLQGKNLIYHKLNSQKKILKAKVGVAAGANLGTFLESSEATALYQKGALCNPCILILCLCINSFPTAPCSQFT